MVSVEASTRHSWDRLPTWLLLTTTPNEHYLPEFNPPLFVPGLPGGTVDLDRIHEPVIERIIKAYKPLVPALDKFKWSYPTNGSSEGIFHILADLAETGVKRIYVLKGEYEGYREYSSTFRIETVEVTAHQMEDLPKGSVCFISNPSARDGNILSNEFIHKVCKNCRVVLDLAYAGMTRPYKFDVSNKNIIAVVMSLSKPYGVFRFRIGGFAFTRRPVPSLYANKWFKDVPALLTALKLVEEIPPGSLYKKYSEVQRRVLLKIRDDTKLPIEPSDVFLLGYLKPFADMHLTLEQKRIIAKYDRDNWGHRFCLTPYFEMVERGIF